MTTAGVSEDEFRDKKCCSPPTHTLLEMICFSVGHIAHKLTGCLIYAGSLHRQRLNSSSLTHTQTVILTVEDLNGDGLFLLDGLCVWEAGVADVVVPRILSKYISEVEVSVQGLGHPAALRQPLEV